MSRKSYTELVGELSAKDRLARAKDCVETLTHKVSELLKIHANTRLMALSDTVSSKIPRSYAANAFETVRDAILHYQIIRLLALWEKPQDNTNSILAARLFIGTDDVFECIAREHFTAHSQRGVHRLTTESDPELEAEVARIVRSGQEEFATSQAQMAKEELSAIVKRIDKIGSDENLAHIRNVRDHLAHSLTHTRREQKGPVKPTKIGEIGRLMNESVSIVETLYVWVNGTSFDLTSGVRLMAERDANELWNGVSFDIQV